MNVFVLLKFKIFLKNFLIQKIPNVEEVHDLHVVTLKAGVYSLSCHMKSTDPMFSLKRATRMLNTKYKILHTTIQTEDSNTDIELDCESQV